MKTAMMPFSVWVTHPHTNKAMQVLYSNYVFVS